MLTFFPSTVPGCDNISLVGNGICNDETNTAVCNYDGGDCCLEFTSKDNCHLKETCRAGFHPSVGDGFCNDETNNEFCNYDGGDCCGYCIVKEHCSECICVNDTTNNGNMNPLVRNGVCNDETNTAACGYDGGDCCWDVNLEFCSECFCYCQEMHLVGNGFCNDEANNPQCNYDGGDCCVNINTENCSDCACSGGGFITSPGFPQPYPEFLFLDWLIKAPFGTFFEINFIYIDVNCLTHRLLSIQALTLISGGGVLLKQFLKGWK